VDDNHDVADSTVELLLLLGYDARACYDGASALVLAESYHPDVCLIDLNMPGMDGDELAVRLRAGEQPLILVAATAASHDAGCRRIREAGFDHNLVKPVTLAALRAVLGGQTPILYATAQSPCPGRVTVPPRFTPRMLSASRV
jgi:CheY-like chemotaxis protein